MKQSSITGVVLALCLSLMCCMRHQVQGLHAPPERLIHMAEKGWQRALQKHQIRSAVVVLVDFTAPSNIKRLWVYDLNTHATLIHTYVAHGQGSGNTLAKHFSNAPKSHASSIGFYKTGSSYVGRHGYSLHLNGLEPRFNGHAQSRSVVMHPAYYASAAFIAEHHRAGRSWGCFALDPEDSEKIIHTIQNGHLLLAYGDDQIWRHHSTYLNR